jgi:hypothetical protein
MLCRHLAEVLASGKYLGGPRHSVVDRPRAFLAVNAGRERCSARADFRFCHEINRVWSPSVELSASRGRVTPQPQMCGGRCARNRPPWEWVLLRRDGLLNSVPRTPL